MCVEYLMANLILLCSLKYISLLWNIFARTWAIFSHPFLFLFFYLFILDFSDIHPMSLFITNFWEKYYQELEAFILIKPNIFLSSPYVGAEHVEVDDKHVFTYLQYRSSTYMWRVRDFNLESMINLSTRINKTWQNSTQGKQLMWKVFNETNIWLW